MNKYNKIIIPLGVSVLIFLALVSFVFVPVMHFEHSFNDYTGKNEMDLIQKFGEPKFIVTSEDVQQNPANWQWWGQNHRPKPNY